MTIERCKFYDINQILKEVEDKINKVDGSIDYITFVADGEPTLDKNLGKSIKRLKAFEIKTAVISNSSLIWREDVRQDLMESDWVSVKIDSTREDIWKKINRPHGHLSLQSILDGILEFSKSYGGKLVTETMLIEGINDDENCTKETADFIAKIKPDKAYISIPTRPPAEGWVKPPEERVINTIYQIMNEKIDDVEYLIGYEGNDFSFSGNIEEDLLSITSVHPMREEAVKDFLDKAQADWKTIENLISNKLLCEVEYRGNKYYIRNINRKS